MLIVVICVLTFVLLMQLYRLERRIKQNTDAITSLMQMLMQHLNDTAEHQMEMEHIVGQLNACAVDVMLIRQYMVDKEEQKEKARYENSK